VISCWVPSSKWCHSSKASMVARIFFVMNIVINLHRKKITKMEVNMMEKIIFSKNFLVFMKIIIWKMMFLSFVHHEIILGHFKICCSCGCSKSNFTNDIMQKKFKLRFCNMLSNRIKPLTPHHKLLDHFKVHRKKCCQYYSP
jgi:hypothetical protein